MSEGYKGLKLWQYKSEAQRIGYLARGTSQMSLLHFVVMAQNSLNGIAYTIPEHISKTLRETTETWIDILSVELESEGRFGLLDLIHVCAGIFAAKSYDPLRLHGVTPIYPFLEPKMVQLSTAMKYQDKRRPAGRRENEHPIGIS